MTVSSTELFAVAVVGAALTIERYGDGDEVVIIVFWETYWVVEAGMMVV